MKKTTEELEFYVRKKLRGGYPAGELQNELLAEGYTMEEIEPAFLKTIGRSSDSSASNPGQYPFWFFLAVGFLILGLSFKSIQPRIWTGHWTDIIFAAGLIGTIAGIIFIQAKKQKSDSPNP